MKNKGFFILGIIILANTAYADEKPVEIITDGIELQRIFMQTTLDEVEKGLPKKYVPVKEIPVTKEDRINPVQIISVDFDEKGTPVVKKVETVDISQNSVKKEYVIPEFVQTKRTVKKWTVNDIENYYRQKTDTVSKNYKGNIHKKSQGDLTIYFSEGLNFADTREISDLHNYITENRIKSIRLVGHADKTGNSKKNAEISVYRADKVKQELIKYGIKKDIITITGRGDIEPSDTVNIKRNRRVEVFFIK